MKPFVKALLLVLLISCFRVAGSHAGWIENGVPLTREWGATGGGVIATDGSSGAIIAYQACREGVGCIIAQRVDSLGVALWGDEGIEVCTATGEQELPKIISDGAGGAIITWQDNRNGDYDIYAQRVNASGTIQWTNDGAAICTVTGDQTNPTIVSDGAGGAIVTWMDDRSGNYDIYAQRVSASGLAQWTADGLALCAATGYEWNPVIVSDGAGGAIVTWNGSGGVHPGTHAQRVDASGAVQWTANGVPLCATAGDQRFAAIISDGAGGAIVTWQDSRSGINWVIYAQRVDASGAIQWASNGVALCTATGAEWFPVIVSDGAGGAIVTWQDQRSGSYDIYAQRVNTSGAVQWTTDGIALCTAPGDEQYPSIASDGAGGAIVTWQDKRSGSYSDIYAQRVNSSGAVQWTTNGIPLCTLDQSQSAPDIVFDNAGGAIVAWTDFRSYSGDIYAQRVNASGAAQWTADGVALRTATGSQWAPNIVSDGAGGAIVAWCDQRSARSDIYAQRVDASGAVEWTTNGVALCTATGDQQDPAIVSDGAGGAIVTWWDYRSGSYHIYAQRVNASGTVQWTANGVAICTAAGNQYEPTITSDGAGGAIVTWWDGRSGNYDIYVQKVNASGAVQWTANGVALCTATGDQLLPTIVSDGTGGAIVTWEDLRTGSGLGHNDIYAQRVSALGAIQWTTDGVPLCTATGAQQYPEITSDGAGGAIVAWTDVRVNDDIYAQKVNASGAVQWTANGVALCTATGIQDNPEITSDGAGGAIVTWQDYRGGSYDIYAQRVIASGIVQWTTDGAGICLQPGSHQESPAITSDGAGGAVITWQDQRGGWDIFAQRVDALGSVQWTTDGVALCTAAESQANPVIVSDGAAGAIVAWQDDRCSRLIYAQRIRASGEIVATTLQQYSAALEGGSIRIGWALSEIDASARFLILRASAPDWEYIELKDPAITQNGLSFTLTDTGCLPGSTYKYRVEYEIGTARRILFETDAISMPSLPVTLYQNHPNPFNPQTVIRFYLPDAQEIFLDVYNVAGERVARLAQGKKEKGYHEVIWDGRNSSRTVCSSGVYFSRLRAGKSTAVRKMILLR